MLLSHRNRFIYLKTIKTAGTSVEIYFEPYCYDEREYPGPTGRRLEYTSEAGIVGFRGNGTGAKWWNHMPAALVRDYIGNDVWNSYLKFCCIRNPYDKAVSEFWRALPAEERLRLRAIPFVEVRSRFSTWLCSSTKTFLDRAVYTIEGQICVNAVIRYECLLADLERICRRLEIPFQAERLGRYKGDRRLRSEPWQAYYDLPRAEIIQNTFALEFEWFGYDPESYQSIDLTSARYLSSNRTGL